MTVGIWTPVVGSTKVVAFGPELLNSLANRTRTITLVAGTHMLITVLGCLPVFIHTAEPTTDDIGYTGVPVTSNEAFIMPAATQIWIYSPYEVVTVIASVGTLT